MPQGIDHKEIQMFDRLKPSYLKQRRPDPIPEAPAGYRYAGDDFATGDPVFIPEDAYRPDPDAPSCSWCETTAIDCTCHDEAYLIEQMEQAD